MNRFVLPVLILLALFIPSTVVLAGPDDGEAPDDEEIDETIIVEGEPPEDPCSWIGIGWEIVWVSENQWRCECTVSLWCDFTGGGGDDKPDPPPPPPDPPDPPEPDEPNPCEYSTLEGAKDVWEEEECSCEEKYTYCKQATNDAYDRCLDEAVDTAGGNCEQGDMPFGPDYFPEDANDMQDCPAKGDNKQWSNEAICFHWWLEGVNPCSVEDDGSSTTTSGQIGTGGLTVGHSETQNQRPHGQDDDPWIGEKTECDEGKAKVMQLCNQRKKECKNPDKDTLDGLKDIFSGSAGKKAQ